MDFVTARGLDVCFLDDPGLIRAFELMVQSADRPMDLADASLVVLAETLKLRKVFTIDRSDFATYRSNHPPAKPGAFDRWPLKGA